MAVETFDVCDRCGHRNIRNGREELPSTSIEPVTVNIGSGQIKKDLCRQCRQELGRWIEEKNDRPIARTQDAFAEKKR